VSLTSSERLRDDVARDIRDVEELRSREADAVASRIDRYEQEIADRDAIIVDLRRRLLNSSENTNKQSTQVKSTSENTAILLKAQNEASDLASQVRRLADENARLESNFAACRRDLDAAREDARTARLRELEAKQTADRDRQVTNNRTTQFAPFSHFLTSFRWVRVHTEPSTLNSCFTLT
jgi:outer membrane murein-binding lipoprotein Lpp